MSWMSSVAEYLTKSPDDIVFEVMFSLASSETLATPKSQTSGSPLPIHRQHPYSYESDPSVNSPRQR